MQTLKQLVREVLIFFHLDLTQNLKYDRITKKILKKHLGHDFNCIDVGCHKGEILNLMLKYSPKGKHFAFEPIPDFFQLLKQRFDEKVNILPFALSDTNGETDFQYVRNAPAYSGIKKREYAIKNPRLEKLKVPMRTLDDLIPSNEKIDFIKIDVEGGEFAVLKGAQNLLKNNKPLVLFEFGKGASDFYGTDPVELYDYLTKEVGLNIYTLDAFMKNENAIGLIDFINSYNHSLEYYFVASSRTQIS